MTLTTALPLQHQTAYGLLMRTDDPTPAVISAFECSVSVHLNVPPLHRHRQQPRCPSHDHNARTRHQHACMHALQVCRSASNLQFRASASARVSITIFSFVSNAAGWFRMEVLADVTIIHAITLRPFRPSRYLSRVAPRIIAKNTQSQPVTS